MPGSWLAGKADSGTNQPFLLLASDPGAGSRVAEEVGEKSLNEALDQINGSVGH